MSIFTNMKKIILSILAIIIAAPAFSQYTITSTSYKKEYLYYYGLRLGLGVSAINSDDEKLDGGSLHTGLNVGALIGFQLSPKAPVYLETGLYYAEKGGKGKIDKKKFTYNLNYFEVPLVIKYKYEVDGDFSVQPFAGGYLAYGIAGKYKDYKERRSESSFGSDKFKRFDGGLRLGCGFEYSTIYGELAYDLGLANICHDEFDRTTNGAFSINFGVNF